MMPRHEEIVEDLKIVRRKGLTALRHVRLPWLIRAAEECGLTSGNAGDSVAVENLLRSAVEGMDAGRLADAAGYTFGLRPGTRDWPAHDRRRRSASIYGVSEDRFRKHYERLVIAQTAESVLRICAGRTALTEHAPVRTPDPADDVCWTETVPVRIGHRRRSIAVHACSVEMLVGVDVVVSTTNTHLEPAQTFKTSLSASLRRSASKRGPAGEIIEDVVAAELAAWARSNGRHGLAVAPGTVVPTSSGELSGRGITRIYHAAIASPRPGTNGYDVDPAVVAQAVQNVFRVGRAERVLRPELKSICLPLFGAGRGGLAESVSFSWTWAALVAELERDCSWELHFVARRASTARMIVSELRALDTAGE